MVVLWRVRFRPMVRGIRSNDMTDPSERSAAANPQTRRDDEPKHGAQKLAVVDLPDARYQ
jgi:hypothetical protein